MCGRGGICHRLPPPPTPEKREPLSYSTWEGSWGQTFSPLFLPSLRLLEEREEEGGGPFVRSRVCLTLKFTSPLSLPSPPPVLSRSLAAASKYGEGGEKTSFEGFWLGPFVQRKKNGKRFLLLGSPYILSERGPSRLAGISPSLPLFPSISMKPMNGGCPDRSIRSISLA